MSKQDYNEFTTLYRSYNGLSISPVDLADSTRTGSHRIVLKSELMVLHAFSDRGTVGFDPWIELISQYEA